jgi:hypothetical protein
MKNRRAISVSPVRDDRSEVDGNNDNAAQSHKIDNYSNDDDISSAYYDETDSDSPGSGSGSDEG